MRSDWPIHDIAIVTFELASACSIGSGAIDADQDAPLALDVNGLPYVPGTSLTGVLRRVLGNAIGVNCSTLDRWFGKDAHADRPNEGLSQLIVHDGCLHDSKNDPVVGEISLQSIEADALLKDLIDKEKRVQRQRNRHNSLGVAEDKGLFERTLVPKGVRFTLELRIETESPQNAQAIWSTVQMALCHPAFRLGGGTRAGLGRVAMLKWRHDRCDMRIPLERERRLRWPSRVSDALRTDSDLRVVGRSQSLPAIPARELCPLRDLSAPTGHYVGYLHLGLLSYWRVGAGNSEKANLKKPYRERVVRWSKGENRVESGQFTEEWVVPGSAIKGVIAHRMAFHARRECGAWRKPTEPKPTEAPATMRPESVDALLGSMSEGTNGEAGRLWLDDVYLPIPESPEGELPEQTYIAIDRLTQGQLNGALRGENLLLPQVIRVPVTLLHRQSCKGDASSYAALHATLEQLFSGELPIGGHSAAGHGLCRGHLQWESLWHTMAFNETSICPQ